MVPFLNQDGWLLFIQLLYRRDRNSITKLFYYTSKASFIVLKFNTNEQTYQLVVQRMA